MLLECDDPLFELVDVVGCDYPHSEGTATPLADYATAGCDPGSCPGLFHDNVTFLLGQ